jgi:hypothetical protein
MPDDIATLRAALDAANRRNAALTQEANSAHASAHQANQGQVAGNINTIANAIEQLKAAQNLARQKWTALQQEGNFEDAGQVTQDMAEQSARLAQLEGEKRYWEQQQAQLAQQQPRQVRDPLAGYSQEERAWIDQHPGYMNDPAFKHKVDSAASEAMNVHGYQRNSQQYFDHINAAVDGQAGGGADVDDAGAFSDTGESNEPLQQRHTIDLPAASPHVETPVLRTQNGNGDQPVEPQQRAVGRGGTGISGAAPPSRRALQQHGANVTQGRASLSQDELATAIALVETIEGDKAAGWTNQQKAEWYYTHLHHPSHANTRRRSWARDAAIA